MYIGLLTYPSAHASSVHPSIYVSVCLLCGFGASGLSGFGVWDLRFMVQGVGALGLRFSGLASGYELLDGYIYIYISTYT